MSPHCDLDLEDSKPVFLHDALYDDGSPQHDWSQKVQLIVLLQLWYCLGKLHGSFHLCCEHEHNNPIFLKNTKA